MSAPAAQPKPLVEIFEAALREFRNVGELVRGSSATGTSKQPDEPDEARNLRLALAIRDWSQPAELLSTQLDPMARLRALDTLAPQCEIGSGRLLGRWLLRDAPRVWTLNNEPRVEIVTRLNSLDGPDKDPTTTALRRVFDLEAVALDSLDSVALRHLLAAAEWMRDRAPRIFASDELQRLLERATRRDGYRALTAHGVFGRDDLLDDLQRSLGAPYRSGIQKTFIWGSGGTGKSTVLAAVGDRLLNGDRNAAIVHLDFDRSDLDPLRPYTLDLEVLRQVGTVDSAFNERLKGIADSIRKSLDVPEPLLPVRGRGRRRVRMRTPKSAAVFESHSAQSKSEMFGVLQPLRAMRKPLILIVDTFEQIEASGEDQVEAVERWIATLGRVSGIGDFRILACGRNHPGDAPSLRSFDGSGWNVIELRDLAQPDAIKMLHALKVPDQLAEEVTSSLPGNPLVLRLVADIFANLGPQVLQETTREVRRRKITGVLVQGVLYDRILKHIGNEDARRYAHPGLVLPEVTPELIRAVLVPVMEPKAGRISLSRAEVIFDALAETSWLVTKSPHGKSLTQRRDLRQLMLQLMRADSKGRAQVAKIREKAIRYHGQRTGASNRAFALYHRLMGVRVRGELAAFDKYNYAGLGAVLRPHLGDLPEIARTYLADRIGQTIGRAAAREQLSDRAWERYLA